MALEAKKLRELDEKELAVRAAELQKEMFDLRTKSTRKEQINTARMRDARRDYARILTVLKQKRSNA